MGTHGCAQTHVRVGTRGSDAPLRFSAGHPPGKAKAGRDGESRAAANLKTGEFMSQFLGKKIRRVLQLIKKKGKKTIQSGSSSYL